MITCQAVPSSRTIAYSHKYTPCVIWTATLPGAEGGVAFRARGIFTRFARLLLLGAEVPPRYVRPPTIDDVQAPDGEAEARANGGHRGRKVLQCWSYRTGSGP
jgi:hypothetical protein